jgi:hypothetical protein
MTQNRKSRSKNLELEALKAVKDDLEAPEIFRMSQRIEYYEELRAQDKLPTTFIALEALSMLMGGHEKGHSKEALSSAWPSDWNEGTFEVPKRVIAALVIPWLNYKELEAEKSLGQVFGLEPSLSTSRKTITSMKVKDQHLSLANEVELNYLAAGTKGKGSTLETVIEGVATTNNVSFETVKNAHKAHKERIRNGLRSVGLLKG